MTRRRPSTRHSDLIPRLKFSWPFRRKTYLPLAHESRRNSCAARAVRVIWVRAHARIAVNKRVNELTRRAALIKKTALDNEYAQAFISCFLLVERSTVA
ncbi:hypothetical protein EVAR_103053_1 [Eumeta japonica]|uniref:RNase H type-1 domain-containing protein n=1 Tax=Eumeta variegata TaxID=151549 RepID=A0A4C1WBB9_EUMVA|nr:hypothetical protein EVAR_103053_1 [Eumeta japonica]